MHLNPTIPANLIADFSPTQISTKKRKGLIINPFLSFLSGLLDSNQRPRAPQTCALPTAPNPEQCLKVSAKVENKWGKTKHFNIFLSALIKKLCNETCSSQWKEADLLKN